MKQRPAGYKLDCSGFVCLPYVFPSNISAIKNASPSWAAGYIRRSELIGEIAGRQS